MDKLWDFISTKGADLGWRILMAALLLLVGCVLIRLLVRGLGKILSRTKVDGTVIDFSKSAVKVCGYIVLGVIVATTLQIPTIPLVTILGVVGLAFSLAAKDTLSNVASGLMILVTREFSLHDYIEVDGVEGRVTRISLVHTTLNTIDNKRVYIPNSQITGSKTINYSAEENRRLDLTFSVSYDDDVSRAKAAILRAIEGNDLAMKSPTPVVRMCGHGDNAILIIAKVWVAGDHYWDLTYDLYEAVMREFEREGIRIPYPQRDVHIYEQRA